MAMYNKECCFINIIIIVIVEIPTVKRQRLTTNSGAGFAQNSESLEKR